MTGETNELKKERVETSRMSFGVSPNEFRVSISNNYASYDSRIVKEQLSVKSVNDKIDDVADSLVFHAKSPLRYISRPCLNKEKTVVFLRNFPVKNFRRDLILPTEIPMSAQDSNTGFGYPYYKKVYKCLEPIENATESDDAFLKKLCLSLGLYNEKFFNLIAYDRVFKRYLVHFLRSAAELPSTFESVYCLVPRLDPSLKAKGALLYLGRIVVCTPRREVILKLKRDKRYRDMDVLMFKGLEGKRLCGVWEGVENRYGLEKIDDVLMLPGGQVRYVDERYEGENSISVSVVSCGDERWRWNVPPVSN